MASTRKSRTINKRFSKIMEESPDKEGEALNRSKMRKRKLSDMLGSRWSKDELERFYEAYRKFGKNWKKVAGTIRNRSIDMVEALYNMNKAYLSLPDGMATAAGLIAMMTDHYNNLEGSESDRESNDETKVSLDEQKRPPKKLRLHSSKRSMGSSDLLQYQSRTPNFGCLSLLKKKPSDSGGSQPRVVGKRTPRFPVSHASNRTDRDKSISARRSGLKPEKDTDDDEGVHVAALALAQACERGRSPHVSRALAGKKDIQRDKRSIAQMDFLNSKASCHLNEEQREEGSSGSREAETEDFIRGSSLRCSYEGSETIVKKRKVRKIKGKRSKVVTEDSFDDTREACSGTEEGLNTKSIADKASMDVGNHRVTPSSRGRSRQLFEDENKEFDALQTLADLSLNILTRNSAVESESSVQVTDEKPNIDVIDKVNVSERLPKHYQRDKTRISANKEKIQKATAEVDTIKQKGSKTRKISSDIDIHTRKQEMPPINKKQKRKNKNMEAKLPKLEVDEENSTYELNKIEGAVEDDKKTPNEMELSCATIPSSHRVKPAKPPENSSSSTDMSKTATDATESAHQVSATSEVHLTGNVVNRRKVALKNTMARKGLKSYEGTGENRPYKFSVSANERPAHLEETLSHCLSSPLLRRWCMFEWFYSAIDYPWFAKSEFVEYLNHVGLGHVPRLTRIEWGVIRSSLGKPRRLSQHFLKEEREKLEQYRESVRSHYAELRAGAREGLPADLARPLSVGQRVIACHPKTREIHDGNVLTVDHRKYLVQFDQPELGVESVTDADCMPLNPGENMPDALKKQNLMVGGLVDICNGLKPFDLLKEQKFGASSLLPANDNWVTDGSNGFSSYPLNMLIKQVNGFSTVDAIGQAKSAINQATAAARHAMYTQTCTPGQIHAKEDDIKILADLARVLDKKEALLTELGNLNADLLLMQKVGDSDPDMERFRRQYAMVLMQLKSADGLISSAIHSLRQRNTYLGYPTGCFSSSENTNEITGVTCSLNQSDFTQGSSSHVVEMVESTRRQARTMVDVAVQAICSVKVGEDALTKVGEAIDSSEKWQSVSDQGVPPAKSINATDQRYCNSAYQAPGSYSSESMVSIEGHEVKCSINDRDDSQFPSELISSCVASALMIQRCAERQLPPAEVAQALESAVSRLSPRCAQNLPIYREIEDLIGAIKNQMLALVPSHSSTLPLEHSVA